MDASTNTLAQPDGTPGSNKRKTYDQRYVIVGEQPRVKKVRLKRGALDDLVNQPGDVMYEVRSSLVFVFTFN
jgi:hypothetical protein